MKILLFIVLLISAITFGFETNDDYEEEKKKLEAEKESEQNNKMKTKHKDQSYRRQQQKNFLIKQNNVQPHFLQEEDKIN